MPILFKKYIFQTNKFGDKNSIVLYFCRFLKNVWFNKYTAGFFYLLGIQSVAIYYLMKYMEKIQPHNNI